MTAEAAARTPARSDGGGGGTGPAAPRPTAKKHCADVSCDKNATCDDSGGAPKCTCNSGYSGDGKTCRDVDECAKNNGGCDAHATCVNREGSFRCVCNETFTGDGQNLHRHGRCADAMLNTCDPNAACSDTETSFSCGACDKPDINADSGACADWTSAPARTAA